MLPAQRGDMGEQGVGHVGAAVTQMAGGAVEIDCVPQDDGRDDEVEAGGAVSQVLEGAIAKLAEPVEEDRAGERVAGLALVEVGVGAATQIGTPEAFRSRSISIAFTLAALPRPDWKSSTSINSGANLRSVAYLSVAITSGSCSTVSAISPIWPRAFMSAGHPTVVSSAAIGSRPSSSACARVSMVMRNRRISRATSRDDAV